MGPGHGESQSKAICIFFKTHLHMGNVGEQMYVLQELRINGAELIFQFVTIRIHR